MILSSANIRELSGRIGFDLCGIAPARPLAAQRERFERWLDEGYCSSMGYLRRNIAARFDPSAMFEKARSVIVCAVNYKSEAMHPRIASYALNEDYHTTVGAMLEALGMALGEGTGYRAFVDSSPVAEKSWAAEAGLGWIGRNSLLITPRYGSMVILGGLFIDREADRYDTPLEWEGCGTCRICIKRCPTGAILGTKEIDTNLCISRLTIERGTEAPRDSLKGWIFGCDECQRCCPHNTGTPIAKNRHFGRTVEGALVSDNALLSMGAEEFEAKLGHTPFARCGIERIRRRV